MKISSEYVKAFKTVLNKLKRETSKSKDKEIFQPPDSPTEMLVLGILSNNETYARAAKALECIQNDMVDLNELRVTPIAELSELLEPFVSDPRKTSTEIIKTLNVVLNRFDTLDLSEFKEKTKGELSKLFEEIPGCPDHARCAMLLLSFSVPTMPLDDRMLEYLTSAGALPKEVDLHTARSFIERQLKASEIAGFYWQLRKAVESEDKKKKPKK